MSFDIKSTVVALETKQPLPGLDVHAMDADLLFDDPLGVGQTDAHGICRITVEMGLLPNPNRDVTLVVKNKSGQALAAACGTFLRDVTQDLCFEVAIPCFRLLEAGVLATSDLPAELAAITMSPAFRDLSLSRAAREDELVAEIEGELKETGTVLALLRRYIESQRASVEQQAGMWRKLGKLFEMGRDCPVLDGHHHGVVLGVRPAGGHPLSSLDDTLGLLWGTNPQVQSRWVGKTFRRADQAALEAATGISPVGSAVGSLGLNHFVHLDGHPEGSVSFRALARYLDMQKSSADEQQAFGYQRSGGVFVAGTAASVWTQSPRQVLALNYRWPSLDNRPPLSWLIDEMVQISDGLYLGQMLLASRRLLSDFNARRPAEDYAYQHRGYFVLWRETWNGEAQRLFPFLDIPVPAL